MNAIKLPLRFWIQYKKEHNKKEYREYYTFVTSVNQATYEISIKYKKIYIYIKVFVKWSNIDYMTISKKILISTVKDDDLKFLKNRIFEYDVKSFQ
jgi:hypothetical protein